MNEFAIRASSVTSLSLEFTSGRGSVLRSRAALTIQTTMRCTCTAGKCDLSAQRLARPMNPYGGIVGCDARLFAKLGQTAFLQINPRQSLAILRLQSIQQSGDALAYFALKRGLWLNVRLKL